MPRSEVRGGEQPGGPGWPAPPGPLIVGLGNLLLGDDGVGVHAVRGLYGELGLWTVEVGTALLDGLHLFEATDRILAIDAMQAGGAPGTIYALSPSEVEDAGVRGSLHGVGLLAALRFLPRHRPEVAILAVEPERIEYGLELSPAVQAALPRLLELTRRIATDWNVARELAHRVADG